MRRIVPALAIGTGLAVAAALASSPAADAATIVRPGCVTATGSLPYVLYGLPSGDTLALQFDVLGDQAGPAEACYLLLADALGDASIALNDDENELLMATFGPDGVAIAYFASEATGLNFTAAVNCSYPDRAALFADFAAAGSVVNDYCGPDGVPIPPVYQQTTPLADGSCDIVDPSYDLSGVASGGWTASWAEWPNDGAGGSVCTRTLQYSDADGWAVAP